MAESGRNPGTRRRTVRRTAGRSAKPGGEGGGELQQRATLEAGHGHSGVLGRPGSAVGIEDDDAEIEQGQDGHDTGCANHQQIGRRAPSSVGFAEVGGDHDRDDSEQDDAQVDQLLLVVG